MARTGARQSARWAIPGPVDHPVFEKNVKVGTMRLAVSEHSSDRSDQSFGVIYVYIPNAWSVNNVTEG